MATSGGRVRSVARRFGLVLLLSAPFPLAAAIFLTLRSGFCSAEYHPLATSFEALVSLVLVLTVGVMLVLRSHACPGARPWSWALPATGVWCAGGAALIVLTVPFGAPHGRGPDQAPWVLGLSACCLAACGVMAVPVQRRLADPVVVGRAGIGAALLFAAILAAQPVLARAVMLIDARYLAIADVRHGGEMGHYVRRELHPSALPPWAFLRSVPRLRDVARDPATSQQAITALEAVADTAALWRQASPEAKRAGDDARTALLDAASQPGLPDAVRTRAGQAADEALVRTLASDCDAGTRSCCADLARMAVAHDSWAVRQVAVHYLTDPALLARIASSDGAWGVRVAAATRIKDQAVLARIALTDVDLNVRWEALRNLADEMALVEIARKDADTAMRREALSKLRSPAALSLVIRSDAPEETRLLAQQRLSALMGK